MGNTIRRQSPLNLRQQTQQAVPQILIIGLRHTDTTLPTQPQLTADVSRHNHPAQQAFPKKCAEHPPNSLTRRLASPHRHVRKKQEAQRTAGSGAKPPRRSRRGSQDRTVRLKGSLLSNSTNMLFDLHKHPPGPTLPAQPCCFLLPYPKGKKKGNTTAQTTERITVHKASNSLPPLSPTHRKPPPLPASPSTSDAPQTAPPRPPTQPSASPSVPNAHQPTTYGPDGE